MVLCARRKRIRSRKRPAAHSGSPRRRAAGRRRSRALSLWGHVRNARCAPSPLPLRRQAAFREAPARPRQDPPHRARHFRAPACGATLRPHHVRRAPLEDASPRARPPRGQAIAHRSLRASRHVSSRVAGRTAAAARSPLLIPVALFCASAAFVLWRNSQVGVLADLAYPLNTATRIAAGDLPYRDFPLAQAPGEFLIQALLIKASGPHFAIHIAYATPLGGLATALTYVIVLQIIRGALASPRAVAAILAFPLVPLGIYAVYPHPFYDADACLAVLIAIVAILVARDRPTPATWLVAGGLIAVPIFIKQNIGGAFLVLSVAALAAEALARVSARQGFHWCVAGIVVTLGVEILALQLFVGVDHYLRWAWTFALAGRGVSLARFREFADPPIVWPAALIVLLAFVSPFLQPRFRTPLFLAGLGAWLVSMVLAPTAFFAVPRLFPPLLIAASVLALARAWRDGPNFAALLPLVVARTTLGTLQSLGLNGSAFGIFPMLMIAIGSLVHDLARLIDRPH